MSMIGRSHLAAFAVVVFLSLFSGVKSTDYSVFFDPDHSRFYLVVGRHEGAAATGTFKDVDDLKGWAEFWADASTDYNDTIKAEAVGYLEGSTTHRMLRDYFDNINKLFESHSGTDEEDRKRVRNFLEEQRKWTNDMTSRYSSSSEYWRHMDLLSKQLRGMLNGYNEHCPQGKELTHDELWFVQAWPDVGDITAAVSKKSRVDWLGIPTEQAKRKFLENSHCSSLVKLIDMDLLSAHDTWIFFSMLNRVYKHIHLPFNSVKTAAEVVSMSSYPGLLASSDDYYLLSSQLVVMETTNGIFNDELYSYVSPSSALAWQRVMVANRAASDGATWSNMFAQHNSGTYNCQWILVDYKQYEADATSNVLWIAEQIPGKVMSGDQTKVLTDKGYWASYNIPFYPEIFNASGYVEMEKKHGEQFSYGDCFRAKIFRRNQTQVESFEDMKSLMRYNDFQNDPISHGDPSGAICLRMDLAPNDPAPFGCTDSKITSAQRVNEMKTEAVYGPTHEAQKPFNWNKFPSWPQQGLPQAYDFDWQSMDAKP